MAQDTVPRQGRKGTTRSLWRVTRSDDRTGSSILAPALLGAILVGISYWLFLSLITPPVPPTVEGSAVIYVDNPRIATQMRVTFDPAAYRQPERSPFVIELTFFAPAPPTPQGTAVRWALVLYENARLIKGTYSFSASGDATIEEKAAADPPLGARKMQPVQVIHGTTPINFLTGRSPATLIKGELPVEVFAGTDSKFALSLPRYGRMQPPFPDQPGKIDFGVSGDWSRPVDFQVDVDAGPNGAEYRIDTASPRIADPARLEWKDGESVRALLQRTNLRQEADQQKWTFVLGAMAGAGAGSILTAVERLVSGLRPRAGRDRPAPGDPADPPKPAD